MSSPAQQMKCIYINLDKAVARRAQLEENWAAHRGSGWELERFPAVDTRYVEENGVPGKLRPGEKGCFLSHCAAIAMHVGSTVPLLMLEDDAQLGPRTAAAIGHFLRTHEGYDWDIAFTDACIPLAPTMMDLLALRQSLADGEVRVLDLADITFAGSTGYLVNPRSLGKLAELLGAYMELDLPYDLQLRSLVREKKLKALMLFPFVTSLSDESGASQIQEEGAADRIWNAFRKLVWLDRDLDKVRPAIRKIDEELCDEESRLLGVLLAGLMSKSYVQK